MQLPGEVPRLPFGLGRLDPRTGPWLGGPDGVEDPVLLDSVSVSVRQPSEKVLPEAGDS